MRMKYVSPYGSEAAVKAAKGFDSFIKKETKIGLDLFIRGIAEGPEAQVRMVFALAQSFAPELQQVAKGQALFRAILDLPGLDPVARSVAKDALELNNTALAGGSIEEVCKGKSV